MESKSAPNIFEYLDYRKYLADFYHRRKNGNKNYSHRLFSIKAGFRSTGYFSEVLRGRRKLSKAYLPKFARALELNEKEQAYFEALVAFGHAKHPDAKQALYETMVKAMPLRIQRVKQTQMEYFSKWYHVAIREALSIFKIKDEYEALAAALDPPITAGQAKSALKLLSDMDLVEKNPQGYWQAKHVSLFSKGDESAALQLRTFQGEMIRKAREALDRIPHHRRDISCVTMSVSSSGMDRIKKLVDSFHKQMLEVVQSDRGEDRVMQLNLQIFPLTRFEEEHDSPA